MDSLTATAPDQPADAAPLVTVEAHIAAIEAKLARLRAERDEAEQEASAAFARANRASREIIATARERAALVAGRS